MLVELTKLCFPDLWELVVHVPLPCVIEMGEGDMSGLEALFKTQSTLSKAPLSSVMISSAQEVGIPSALSLNKKSW